MTTNKKNTLKTLAKVYFAVSTVQQVAVFGIKFLKGNHEDAVFHIGEYTVHVETDPKAMGMNLVAQTGFLYGNRVDVTVDGLFWVLPHDIQECVLAHEIGHMVCEEGSPDDMQKYALMRMCGICPKEEKVADSYSTKLYGVKRTKRMLKALAAISPSLEIIQRITSVK